MKTCSQCNKPKPESDFYSRKSGRISNPCKQCVSEYDRVRYLIPEVKESKIVSANLLYHKDVDASRKVRRDRYHNNPEPTRERSKQRYLKNPEASHAAARERRRKNPEKVRATENKRRRERQRSDILFRLVRALRSRVRNVLSGHTKSAPSLELLGCSEVQWRGYLESLFKPGMTWENYGKEWHIDHIKPCAKFDLGDPSQQKVCFHWTNTQPLFAAENISKGAR